MGGITKSMWVQMQTSKIELHYQVAELRWVLQAAKKKLELYREAHGPAYVGGTEYTQLMRHIDAALQKSSKGV